MTSATPPEAPDCPMCGETAQTEYLTVDSGAQFMTQVWSGIWHCRNQDDAAHRNVQTATRSVGS